MHRIYLLLMLIVWHLIRARLTLVILDLAWACLGLILENFAGILLVLVVWYSFRARTFLWTWSKLRVAWIKKQLKVLIFSSDVFLFILIVILLFSSLCWPSNHFIILSDSTYLNLLIIITRTIITEFPDFWSGSSLHNGRISPIITFLLHLTIVLIVLTFDHQLALISFWNLFLLASGNFLGTGLISFQFTV